MLAPRGATEGYSAVHSVCRSGGRLSSGGCTLHDLLCNCRPRQKQRSLRLACNASRQKPLQAAATSQLRHAAPPLPQPQTAAPPATDSAPHTLPSAQPEDEDASDWVSRSADGPASSSGRPNTSRRGVSGSGSSRREEVAEQAKGRTVRMAWVPAPTWGAELGSSSAEAVMSRRPRTEPCPACGDRGTVLVGQVTEQCELCRRLDGRPLVNMRLLREVDEWIDRQPPPRKGEYRGPLTPEHKEKISAANSGDNHWAYGKELSTDHRTRIARSMRRLMATNATHRARISASLSGRAKTCCLCGKTGHNKRSCPRRQAHQAQQQQLVEAGGGGVDLVVGKDGVLRRRLRTKQCSFCKELGHNKRGCAKYKEALAAAAEEAARAPPPPPPQPPVPAPAAPPLSVVPMPTRVDAAIAQAVEAVTRAWAAGERRLRVELLLPLPRGAGSGGASDAWSGGITEQFRAARPMVEFFLRQLKARQEFEGRLIGQWLDESDCVGAWCSDRLAAVLFPTAETLRQVRQLAEADPERTVLMINPQWQADGQVVSDFGFGQARAEAEAFVGSFAEAYVLQRRKIMGDDLRLLKCYPAPWQVHYLAKDGTLELLDRQREAPSYEALFELMKRVPGSKSSASWLERLNPNKLREGARKRQWRLGDAGSQSWELNSDDSQASSDGAQQQQQQPAPPQQQQQQLQQQALDQQGKEAAPLGNGVAGGFASSGVTGGSGVGGSKAAGGNAAISKTGGCEKANGVASAVHLMGRNGKPSSEASEEAAVPASEEPLEEAFGQGSNGAGKPPAAFSSAPQISASEDSSQSHQPQQPFHSEQHSAEKQRAVLSAQVASSTAEPVRAKSARAESARAESARAESPRVSSETVRQLRRRRAAAKSEAVSSVEADEPGRFPGRRPRDLKMEPVKQLATWLSFGSLNEQGP